MFKKLLLIAGVIFIFAGLAIAQDYPILWEDHFEDDDIHALHNVGWVYYTQEDIPGQVVEQRDGALFVEAGSYLGAAGVGLVETNGLPQISLDENGNITDATIDSSLLDMWSDPNQILNFQVNFARFTSSFFIVGTRMPIDTSRGDADPTEQAAYALFFSPLQDMVSLGRYDAPMQALDPTSWTYFGQAAYDFDLEVFYRVKWYLHEGDLKLKIWEGDPEDEPAEWLIDAVDPDPRVEGTFTMFGMLGDSPAAGEGDQVYLDDIVMTSSIPGSSVDAKKDNVVANDFQLTQNYPNPFNPTTSISFALTKKDMTKLIVYNTMGQAIRTLVDYEMTAGNHQVTWDGLDDNSNSVSSGVYLYQLISNGQTQSKRMLLMK